MGSIENTRGWGAPTSIWGWCSGGRAWRNQLKIAKWNTGNAYNRPSINGFVCTNYETCTTDLSEYCSWPMYRASQGIGAHAVRPSIVRHLNKQNRVRWWCGPRRHPCRGVKALSVRGINICNNICLRSRQTFGSQDVYVRSLFNGSYPPETRT